MTEETLEVLIEKHLSGTLSPSEESELRRHLAASHEARETFCGHALLDGRLRWEHGATALVPVRRRHRPRATPVVWAAAAVVVVLSGALLMVRQPSTEATLSPSAGVGGAEPLPGFDLPISTVARLTSQRDPDWDELDSSEAPVPGSWLRPGQLELARGTATLTFDSGTVVTLAGPASIELVGQDHARLLSGKAAIRVPESASGFTLETPDQHLTNFESQLGVQVHEQRRSEVHVISGEAETRFGENLRHRRLLTPDSAYTLAGDTEDPILAESPTQPDSFPLAPPAWRSETPGSFIHWNFDSIVGRSSFPASGTLAGVSEFPAQGRAPLDGGRPIATTGRFGPALYLGASLATPCPGIVGAKARTIAFWVKIPAHVEDRSAYSIISWGSPREGARTQKWEIGWNTSRWPEPGTGVKGAIRTDFGIGYVIGSTDLRDGQWHHVASVFIGGPDADVSTHVRHYVDGRLDPISSYRQQPIDTPPGTPQDAGTTIGRYLYAAEGGDFSTFHGYIDELYVFDTALTPGQITTLMHSNLPPAPYEYLNP